MKQGKKITIDILAGMMNKAFQTLETKMDMRFDALETRFERMEHTVNFNHENRLTRLEDNVRVIKTKLNLQN